MRHGLEKGCPMGLELAVMLALSSACGSASNTHAAAPDASTDASEAAGSGGCPTLSGCASDAGIDASPTSDAGLGADAGGGDDAEADSGPPLGLTGNSWYVAKGAPGTAASPCPSAGTTSSAGTTWSNAWGEMDQINWSCVQPGDTVWLAGGTYTHGFTVGASGAAGKPIYIARVRSTDTVPTSAAGWTATFDSQVLVTNTTANNGGSGCNAGDVLCFNQSTLGNYTYWDGRVDSGILLQTSNIAGLSPTNNTSLGQSAADIGTASGDPDTGSNHDITFDEVDFAGPAGSTAFTHASYDAAIQVINVTGNILFTNCRIHGANDNVNISGSSGVTFDHCMFYDNVAGSGSAGHGNMVQYAGNDGVTFRYSEWWNWSVEGIMVWTPSGALYVYGNVFHDADNSGYPSVIQANDTTAGPLYFYNNTIANVSGYCVFRPADSIGWTSSSQARNNLYWNSDVCVQSAPSSDYDACYDDRAANNQTTLGISETTTVAQAEANACTIPAAPFVSPSMDDFQLTANTPPGEDLGAPYNVDKDGNPRTTWTRGAYEYRP
jgi:hypothetical protein